MHYQPIIEVKAKLVFWAIKIYIYANVVLNPPLLHGQFYVLCSPHPQNARSSRPLITKLMLVYKPRLNVTMVNVWLSTFVAKQGSILSTGYWTKIRKITFNVHMLLNNTDNWKQFKYGELQNVPDIQPSSYHCNKHTKFLQLNSWFNYLVQYRINWSLIIRKHGLIYTLYTCISKPLGNIIQIILLCTDIGVCSTVTRWN